MEPSRRTTSPSRRVEALGSALEIALRATESALRPRPFVVLVLDKSEGCMILVQLASCQLNGLVVAEQEVYREFWWASARQVRG